MNNSQTIIPAPNIQRWFFIFVLVSLAWGLPSILLHQSDNGVLFGRYSRGYGLAVVGAVGIATGWGLVFLLRGWLWRIAGRLPAALLLIGLLTSGVGTVTLWVMTGVEGQLLQFISVQWFLVALFLTLGQSQQPGGRFWSFLAALLCVLALILLFVTALSGRDYSPDEAIYAANNSHWSIDGRIYRAPYLEEAYRIAPGVGWANVLHSLALEHIAFHIHSGRVINYAFYGLALLMAGLGAQLLYGSMAAFLSVLVLVLGRALFIPFDYRPNHFIAFASATVFYTALRPRLKPGHGRFFWHFLTGLLATLSLQLHALGIALALGMSLFYALDFLYRLIRRDSIGEALRIVVAFGIGALIGTAAYWLLNIMPIGGLDIFLGTLLSERGTGERNITFLQLFLLEAIFVVPGLLFLLVRRERRDWLYLGLLLCAIIAKILVDTQGYAVGYRLLFVIPTGALFVHLLRRPNSGAEADRRLNWVALWTVIALGGFTLKAQIDLNSVAYLLQNGSLRPHSIHALNDAIMDVVDDDSMVVGSIELIWGMQYREGFIAFPAEGFQRSAQGVTDLAGFWEEIAPDVIVNIPRRDIIPPGLRDYMEQADFQLCQTLTVSAHEILFYRPTCP